MKYAIMMGCDQTIAFVGEGGYMTTSPADARVWDSKEAAIAELKPDEWLVEVDEAEFRAMPPTWCDDGTCFICTGADPLYGRCVPDEETP